MPTLSTTSDHLTDPEFITQQLWRIAEGGGAVGARAARIAMERRVANLDPADHSCSVAFPCGHCTLCQPSSPSVRALKLVAVLGGWMIGDDAKVYLTEDEALQAQALKSEHFVCWMCGEPRTIRSGIADSDGCCIECGVRLAH